MVLFLVSLLQTSCALSVDFPSITTRSTPGALMSSHPPPPNRTLKFQCTPAARGKTAFRGA